jgi:hypothetical protein
LLKKDHRVDRASPPRERAVLVGVDFPVRSMRNRPAQAGARSAASATGEHERAPKDPAVDGIESVAGFGADESL